MDDSQAVIRFLENVKRASPGYYAEVMAALRKEGVTQFGFIDLIKSVTEIASNVAQGYMNVKATRNESAVIKEQIKQLQAQRELAAQQAQSPITSAAINYGPWILGGGAVLGLIILLQRR